MRVLLPFNSSFFRNNCIGLEIYSCIVVEVDSSQILNGGENMLQKEICQWSKIRQSIENFKFHSCKADPRWYGARTSNPWENKRSAVRFRLLYVRQTNISTRVRMNVQCQQRQLQQQQWLILFIVFSISWNNSSGLFFVSIHVRLIIIGVGHRLQILGGADT